MPWLRCWTAGRARCTCQFARRLPLSTRRPRLTRQQRLSRRRRPTWPPQRRTFTRPFRRRRLPPRSTRCLRLLPARVPAVAPTASPSTLATLISRGLILVPRDLSSRHLGGAAQVPACLGPLPRTPTATSLGRHFPYLMKRTAAAGPPPAPLMAPTTPLHSTEQ